jgi:hypothetical protein
MALTDYVRLGWAFHLCLWNCSRCQAVVTDRELHDEWHEKIENHGHAYAAAYGPGGQWDTTTGPVPAKTMAERQR